jgi:hypothetical protein
MIHALLTHMVDKEFKYNHYIHVYKSILNPLKAIAYGFSLPTPDYKHCINKKDFQNIYNFMGYLKNTSIL